MTELLNDLAAARRQLLERADELSAVWQEARRVTGGDPDAGLIAADLARIRAELDRRRFTIGVFGLIKRGKSTLLNALLGSELSPTHVTPETAVPVYVDHGPEIRATVHLVSGEEREVDPGDVHEWVSQKRNARNHLGVTHVRWTLPSPLLQNGVRLVDTPGLDDADADDLYTRRTIQELDAADVGVLVFLSPPTVGATEMAFLREVTGAQLRRTLLVANLYPQQYHDPEAREQVVDYVRRQVARDGDPARIRVHAVCAAEAWEARRDGDGRAWRTAGGAGLLEALGETIEQNTGRAALGRAEDSLRQTARLAVAAVDLHVKAVSGGLADEERERLEVHHRELTGRGDDVLDRRMPDVSGMRVHLDAIINELFFRTRGAVDEARSLEELDAVLARFARAVEVVTEEAFRKLHNRLLSIHAESARELDAGVAATLREPGSATPLRSVRSEVADAPVPLVDRTPLQGAAIGGLVTGGAGFALVGSLLGPVGLVAGALVGWRLGSLIRTGRELRPVREELAQRLLEVREAVLEEFDRRSRDLVAAVRAAASGRREGFVHDLQDLLEVLERVPADRGERERVSARLRELSTRLERLPDDGTEPARASTGVAG